MKTFILVILVLDSCATMSLAALTRLDCGEESANQELVPCYSPCPPDGCNTIGIMFSCILPEVCRPGCRCKRIHKRNNSGQCVHIRDCPQPSHFQCRPHEEYSACPEYCQDQRCFQKPPLPCSSISSADSICTPQCRCQEDYCLDDWGKCVAKQESNKTQISLG